MTATDATIRSARVPAYVTRRFPLWGVIAIAAVAASTTSAAAYLLASALGVSFALSLAPGAAAERLPVGMVVVTSIAAALGAAVTFALARRIRRGDVRAFQTAAAIFLALSFAAPLTVEGADTLTRTALIALHVIVAASIVSVFTALARRS